MSEPFDFCRCKPPAHFYCFSKLVDPQVTSFEPVSRGNLVEGLQFHKFYFDNGKRPENSANSIAP